jgi:hypothetical protein
LQYVPAWARKPRAAAGATGSVIRLPFAPGTMLIRSPIANDVFEQQLLASLRETAADLSLSNISALWRFGFLARRCAHELGLGIGCLKFLLGFRSLLAYRAIRRTRSAWNLRLGRRQRRSSARPGIALLISEGQAVRSFLLTDACRKIASWAELYVLSPLDIEEDVIALGSHAHFLPVPMIQRNRLDTLVSYLGYRQTGSPTNLRFAKRLDESLERASRNKQPVTETLRVWQMAQNYSSDEDYLHLYCWNLRLFAQIYYLNEIAKLLRRLEPDLMFNSSCVSWPARLWTRAAALAAIPVISNVISWDNMSTKTLLDEFADTYLIWSDEMDEDFSTTLPFLRDKSRVVVGSPQFEPTLQGRGLVSRAKFLGSHGLDPTKQLILYTTGSKTLFPREPECLDRLLGHWRGNLQQRATIMVRMHPKDSEGRYKAVREKFTEVPFTMAGRNLASDDDWLPTRDDISLLVNQLHHCDLVVNVASTMTLEGFAIDKPAINIGFTLGSPGSARYPMEDYYKSRHYGDVVATGAARLVSNYEQLFAAIDDVLDRHAYDVEKQRRIMTKKCKYIADSSDRINEFLQAYAARVSRAGSARNGG